MLNYKFFRTTTFAIVTAGIMLLPAAPLAKAREVVSFSGYAPGTIVVKTSQRRLYLVISGEQAIRYKVGVGRARHQWSGTTSINGKYIRPAWMAPPGMRRGNSRPKVIPAGAPNNPMGAAAMTLSGRYDAIHGTNAPGSIGGFVSHGCIRMYNRDIMDLYNRVRVGTPVVVKR